MMNGFSIGQKGQRGAILIVSLVMLVAVMLLGIAGIRGTSLQVRMGAGLYDRQIAFQAAESAIRDASAVVATGANPVFDGTNGLYPLPPVVNNGTWVDRWDDPAVNWRGGTAIANGPKHITPEFIVEDLGTWPDPPDCIKQVPRPPLCLSARYRITARSGEAGAERQVVLQSTFRP